MCACEYGSVVRPIWGERVSGDTAVVQPLTGGFLVGIVDVLGHGPEAHDLATDIETYLREHARYDVKGLIERLHEQIRGSRGAAVALCSLVDETGLLRFAGVGNTAARAMGKTDRRLVGQDGVVGNLLPAIREDSLTLGAGDLLVLTTDGVRSQFSADQIPGLFSSSPGTAARKIVRSFGKQHDDASCIVLRYRR